MILLHITTGIALALIATCASAVPSENSQCPPKFNASQPFKLVAYPANISVSAPYNPTDFLQVYSNGDNGMGPQQLFSFAGGVPKSQATNFTYSPESRRLFTYIQNQTGVYEYESRRPYDGYPLNLTMPPIGIKGSLRLVREAHQCEGSTGQNHFFIGPHDTGTYPSFYHPWFLCQVPGFTTGLKNVIYAVDTSHPPSMCNRIALKPVPSDGE